MTRILIVDDSKTDLAIISHMLHDFEVSIAHHGQEAMAILANRDFDLMILDLHMPVMDGFAVLEAIKNDPKLQDIRVIILTNIDEIDAEIRGLELGAVDYIRKPINIRSLRIRIDIHSRLMQAQRSIEQQNFILDAAVEKATQELVITRDITINALVGLIEARNLESYNHITRTSHFMKCLCEHLRLLPSYQSILTPSYIDELVRTTPLHDIGKMAIPDAVLLKPGRLTPEEYDVMKKHVILGAQALRKELRADMPIPSFIVTALEIIQYHHEKYDGTGYPRGLKGADIPLPGRLMALIDVFDALINERIYKKAFTVEKSVAIIEEGLGTHFDPEIGRVFLSIVPEICEINRLYRQ